MKILILIALLAVAEPTKQCWTVNRHGQLIRHCEWITLPLRRNIQRPDCREMIFIDHMQRENEYILCTWHDPDALEA